MHCGKKLLIRKFVPPYIFLLNPDYVTAGSLRSLRSNEEFCIVFAANELTVLFLRRVRLTKSLLLSFGRRLGDDGTLRAGELQIGSYYPVFPSLIFSPSRNRDGYFRHPHLLHTLNRESRALNKETPGSRKNN